MKRMFFSTLAVALGLLLAFTLLELILWLFPVRETFLTESVTADQPYIRYRPNRSIIFSVGWNFSTVAEKRTNNYGYFSASDFDPDGQTPLVAVIGDSYVEAAQVEDAQSVHGVLARRVDEAGRVYGIGISGAPLSQYLAFAEFARDNFDPDLVVVVIVGNDFDESLRKYARRPGQYQFDDCNQQSAPWRLEPLRPDPWYMALAKRSALVRYLMLNVGLNRFVSSIRYRGSAQENGTAFVGNTSASASPQRLDDSRCVVDRFIEMLPLRAGLSPDNIVLVLDGMRPELYSADTLLAAKRTYFSLMRDYVIETATTAGFTVVDLQPVFRADYAHHQLPFEVPADGHWNARAHGLAAQAIAATEAFQRVMGHRDRSSGNRRRTNVAIVEAQSTAMTP